jgi:hypothetical protein
MVRDAKTPPPHYEDQTCFGILAVWRTPAASQPDRAVPLSVFSILLVLEHELPTDLILLRQLGLFNAVALLRLRTGTSVGRTGLVG